MIDVTYTAASLLCESEFSNLFV